MKERPGESPAFSFSFPFLEKIGTNEFMKKFVTLSVAVLGACVVAPFAGKASLPQTTNDPALKSAPVVRSTAADSSRTVYIVTKVPATGTLIPTVYRIYRGRVTSTSSQSGATYTDLSPAGSESVGGSLVKLDPSITLAAHR